MAPRYRVTLTKEERKFLEEISTKGKRAARTVLYARALLLLDAGEDGPKWIVAKVAEALGTTTRSLEHLRKDLLKMVFLTLFNARHESNHPERFNLEVNSKHNFWH